MQVITIKDIAPRLIIFCRILKLGNNLSAMNATVENGTASVPQYYLFCVLVCRFSDELPFQAWCALVGNM